MNDISVRDEAYGLCNNGTEKTEVIDRASEIFIVFFQTQISSRCRLDIPLRKDSTMMIEPGIYIDHGHTSSIQVDL